MSGQVAALLSALQAVGVHVALGASGDTLELTGKRPPAALLDEVRANKAALLEALTLAKTEDAATTDPVYSTSSKTLDHPIQLQAARSSFVGQFEALALIPGHCGSCARWSASPAPMAHMGECSAGRAAHGWYDGNPVAPVEVQAGHACPVANGRGWRAR